jgi:UDP-glucose 4-epimerase
VRALVTGGAGFIGSTLTDRLIADGFEVYVVDNLNSGHLSNLDDARRNGHITFHQFDIRSDGVRTLFEQARPEVVFHLAAQASVPKSVADPVNDAEVNVVGLLRLLDACLACGARKVVFASSGGTIYGNQRNMPISERARGRPASPYGITKRVGEDYLRFYHHEFGLDFTSLALANVYGPRQDRYGEASVVAVFASKLVRGVAPTIDGTGEQTRDFVYVDDVADAFVRAVDRGSGETINVGTGVETKINDLFNVMAAEVRFGEGPQHGPPRRGDLMRNALDVSKAADVLGWRPWTTLSEGVRATMDWFRRQG